MKTLLFAAAAAILGLASAETKFEKCATFGENSKFLCFKTVLDEVVVKMGKGKNDGTNDDVTLTVCDDLNNKCCTTPALSSTFSDDWSKGDTETWGESYFGDQKKGGCKGFVFTVKHGLLVTLSKKGTDNLVVSNITIDTKAPDSKKNKEPERFLCGGFTLGATAGPEANRQTKVCKPGPYQFVRIFDADVKIGNDGTDDDVKVGVCSAPNQGCCEKKLSGAFTDDWAKGKLEHWKTSYFGDCAKKLFKANPDPLIYVKKTGKDDLKVDSFTMQFDVIDTVPKRIKYVCPGFAITGSCKSDAECTRSLTNCRRSNAPVTGSKTPTTTRRTPAPTGNVKKLVDDFNRRGQTKPAPAPPIRRGSAPAAVPARKGSLRNRVLQVFNATVKMGADGTDDDVTVGICSESTISNRPDCCEKKLNKALADNWEKNKVENWKKSAFGDCSKDGKTYRSTSAPKMYVKKNGKDDLVVSNFDIVFDVIGSSPATQIKFSCPGFSLTGDCKKNVSGCRKDLVNCTTKEFAAPPKKKGGLFG